MSFGKRQPAGYRGVERRRAVREKADISAHIILPDGQLMKCRLWDLSSMGARLAVSVFGLPETFELRVPGRQHLVRRGIGHAAVVFR
jgi:hypothetical protein